MNFCFSKKKIISKQHCRLFRCPSWFVMRQTHTTQTAKVAVVGFCALKVRYLIFRFEKILNFSVNWIAILFLLVCRCLALSSRSSRVLLTWTKWRTGKWEVWLFLVINIKLLMDNNCWEFHFNLLLAVWLVKKLVLLSSMCLIIHQNE